MMNKSSNNVNLIIKAKSWIKETEDLFDFESDSMASAEFKVSSGEDSHFIVLHNDKILLLKDFNEVKKKILDKNSSKVLGEVISSANGHFQILSPFQSSKLQGFDKLYLDRLWMVLNKNEQRLVEEGDILKLGRVRLKIDKICIRQSNNYDTNYNNITIGMNYLKTNTTQLNLTNNIIAQSSNTVNNPFNNGNTNSNANLNNSFSNFEASSNNLFDNIKRGFTNEESPQLKEPLYICKICFRSDSDLQDPLITPCKCAGSMGYIHYKCLKQCINVKINTKVGDNYVCYIWKNFECEICLSEYPKLIKYKSLTYHLVDLNITYEQYMIFDYTLYDDLKKKSFRKGIIVVKVSDEGEISIGRTQTNTIKLKDISVSRMHCYFEKKENKIYVADRGSKFGTLLYMNKPFTLSSNAPTHKNNNLYINNTLSLISGKNFFNFSVARNWNFFSDFFSTTLCCKCKSNNDDEFILNFDNLNDSNEITKIKDNSNNNVNDSYSDYVLNLETIIKSNDYSNNNNNNSFI